MVPSLGAIRWRLLSDSLQPPYAPYTWAVFPHDQSLPSAVSLSARVLLPHLQIFSEVVCVSMSDTLLLLFSHLLTKGRCLVRVLGSERDTRPSSPGDLAQSRVLWPLGVSP